MTTFLLASYTLWQREVVRFVRQPSRVLGALGSPFLFWILIGSGIGRSFQPPGGGSTSGYLAYFYPGTLLLIIFFTAIFSTISVIEDRREGFLQSVLVAPIPRASLVFGKILGGTTLAFLEAMLFLFLAPVAGIHLTAWIFVRTAAVLFLNGFVMTGLGFLIAWQFDSIQGFHAVMNLFLMPLWILSGALFPAEGASRWLALVMKLNPLTYGLSALRLSLNGGASVAAGSFQNSMLAAFGFGTAIFLLAVWNVRPSVRHVR